MVTNALRAPAHRVVRLVAAAAAILGLAIAPLAVRGAEGSIVSDGVLTVTVAYPTGEGGGPIEGAKVSVVASVAGSWTAELGYVLAPDGTATFEGVPYEPGVGDPVLLDIVVSAVPVLPPEGTCATVTTYTGSASGLIATASLAMSIETTLVEQEVCAPDDGIPDGVDFDATLIVTVLDEASAPVADAEVRLVAMLDEPPATGGGLAKVGATTGVDGVATIGDLPRPAIGGPAISWLVSAESRVSTTIDGCSYVESWFGAITVAAASGTTELTIVMAKNVPEWGECEYPGPDSPVLTGYILDEEGLPFVVENASILQFRPGGGAWGRPILIDETGRYEQVVHAWGTAEEPSAVTIWAMSPVIGRTVDGDCWSDIALVVEETFQLALSQGPPEMPTITARPREISYGCDPDDGSEGEPSAGPTAPATDTTVVSGSAPMDGSVALPFVAALAGLLVVLLRRSRARA